jgi:hypothetical protein
LKTRAPKFLLGVLTLSVFGGLAAMLLPGVSGRLSQGGVRTALAALCLLAGVSAILACRGCLKGAGKPEESPPPDGGGDGDRKSRSGVEQSLPVIFHEIRNYASTLKGNTLLLRRGLAQGDAEESLQRLERATEQIQRLSHEVLDLSLLGRPGTASRVCLQEQIRQ